MLTKPQRRRVLILAFLHFQLFQTDKKCVKSFADNTKKLSFLIFLFRFS